MEEKTLQAILVEMKAMVDNAVAELKEELTNMKAKTQEVMDVKQAAKYLELSESRVRHLVSSRDIPYFKKRESNRVYFKKSELDGWRAYRPVKTNEDIEIEANKYVLAR